MTVWKSLVSKVYGVAKNNFVDEKKPHRLELDVGDALIIEKECQHWYYGYKNDKPNVKGIFPKVFIHLLPSVYDKNELIIDRSEIVKEITTVIREWGHIFKHYYLTNHKNFQVLRKIIIKLICFRSQLLSGNLPADELKDLQIEATDEIDAGNKLIGLDMVVRDGTGNILDINKTSTTYLFEQHKKADARIKEISTQSEKRISRTMVNKKSRNILLNVQAFVCKAPEDADLVFTLYDGADQRSITENYIVKWGKQGIPRDLDQFNNHFAMFTDLSSQDFLKENIYLVCYGIKVGSIEPFRKSLIIPSGNKKHLSGTSFDETSNDNVRRPFGVGLSNISDLIKKSEDSFKQSIDLPFLLCSDRDNLENTFKKLLYNKDTKFESKIAVTIEIFHGDLKYIKEEYPHINIGNGVHVRKMGFPEVILPDDVRNDLYVTLVNGEFSKGTKTSEKNVEVSATVCNDNGEVLSNVISLGVGIEMQPTYKSVVYYHEDRPKWNETFKIKVAFEDFKNCHVQFLYKHRSTKESKDKHEKPFAMSFVKLKQDDGTTLKDNIHRLLVYKIDHKKYDKDNKSQCSYLHLPSHFDEFNKQTKISAQGLSISPKDSLTIQTNLCSTKLTQDVDLFNLFSWCPESPLLLEATLNKLLVVSDEEIIKFLPDILDVLFNIMVDESIESPNKNQLIFKCLLKLIEIVSDLKYQHFQSVLDLYINGSFSATLAYPKLLSVLKEEINEALSKPSKEQSDKFLFRAMKHVQYIMKFIIRSRELFLQNFFTREVFYPEEQTKMFEKCLEELLDSFRKLMYSEKQYLLTVQGAVLRFLHVIVSDLTQVYDPVKLTKFVVDILTSMGPVRLVQSKMGAMKDLINSKIFKIPKCREILLPLICQQVKEKLESKEEKCHLTEIEVKDKNRKKAEQLLGKEAKGTLLAIADATSKIPDCVQILNNLLEILFRKDIGEVVYDIKEIMIILLRTVIQTAITMGRDNVLVSNLVAIMFGILRVMKKIHYDIYVEHFKTREDLLDFLTEILLLFQDLVKTPVFPIDWMDMIMHQNTVILECLRNLSEIIKEKFFDPFRKQIWMNYFNCSIALLTQPALQLNRFSINKQSTILARYRDIRLETVNEICGMWIKLGENKPQFVPGLVEPILIMSFIPDNEIRRKTIPILFDMMQCEYFTSKYIPGSYGDTKRNNTHCKGNFKEFEKELIEKLDILVEIGHGDEEYKNLFYQIMMKECSAHSTLKQDGESFIEMVTTLLSKLLEYRLIVSDEGKENRMACIVNLLQFYDEAGREEMYIRYVNILHKLHKHFENFTEAALTLKLYCKFLKWSDDLIPFVFKTDDYPDAHTHRELKEKIYDDMINYFNLGETWEYAFEICKELIDQYENVTFEYVKLSKIYYKLHTYYDAILNSVRNYPNYFRVGFFGLKFPEFLRNKVFVYRSRPLERLDDFKDRISNQHPMAEIMLTQAAPGPEITESDAKYIQIIFVEPVVMENSKFFNSKVVSPQIMKYYEKNDVNCFKYSRRLIVEGAKDKNDIRNLWKECTTITTANSLPGVLKWFPVIETNVKRLSPIECAIETIELRNNEITNLIHEHQVHAKTSVSQLAGNIKGIILPEVNGGIKIYEDAFLTEEFLQNNSQYADHIGRLKNAIASQIPLLGCALIIVKEKSEKESMQLAIAMEAAFVELKAKVEANYGKKECNINFEIVFHDSVEMRNKNDSKSMDSFNRASGTSTESAESSNTIGLKFRSTLGNLAGGTTRGSLTKSSSPLTKGKSKDKSFSKRKTHKPDDSSRSLNLSISPGNTQWYALRSLTTIESPTGDNITINTAPVSSAVFELTQELTPQRPLRSEVEREKRLSRPNSIATPTSTHNPIIINSSIVETQSLSGESSNRNSIITTDSTTSEDDIPPPLPAKIRDSNDYSNLPPFDKSENKKPLVPPTSFYDPVIISKKDPRRPPTPPPKPSRNSKNISM